MGAGGDETHERLLLGSVGKWGTEVEKSGLQDVHRGEAILSGFRRSRSQAD